MNPLGAARAALAFAIGVLIATQLHLGRARRSQLSDRRRAIEAEADLMGAKADLWNARAERDKLEHVVELQALRLDTGLMSPDQPAEPEP